MKKALKVKLSGKHVPQLLARGMNRLALSIRPFLLRPASFTADIPGLKPKFVDAEDQIRWYEDVLENPFKAWTFCITSDPNDSMAKLAAAFIMQKAMLMKMDRAPMWHDLMGGFKNPLVDSEVSKPSLLVLANVMPNSTAVKFEKLRDILERFSDVPKIVVSSGDNPFSFFVQHLHYPLHGCVYLKTGLVKKEYEI